MKRPIANPARGGLVVFVDRRGADYPGTRPLARVDLSERGTRPRWVAPANDPGDQLDAGGPSYVNRSSRASSSSTLANPADGHAPVLALPIHQTRNGEHG